MPETVELSKMSAIIYGGDVKWEHLSINAKLEIMTLAIAAKQANALAELARVSNDRRL